MKTNALLLAALALAACSPDFDPASKVEKLRVLAVKAAPPEIDPTGTAALGSLVVRADFAADRSRATTVVYLACIPDPAVPGENPCVRLESLREPTATFADAAAAGCAGGSGTGSGPWVVFAGAEKCDPAGVGCGPVQLADGTPVPAPALSLPAGFVAPGKGFDALPPGSPARLLGVQAVVLAFAVDGDLASFVPGATGTCPLASVASQFSAHWSSTEERVLAMKRVQIRGPEAVDPPNENPVITGITAGGVPLPATLPARDVDLAPDPEDVSGLVQEYTKYYASGQIEYAGAREDWVYSWFATAGEMEDLHTRPPETERWKIGPESSWGGSVGSATGGHTLVAAVVRDLRGGVEWQVREVVLEP